MKKLMIMIAIATTMFSARAAEQVVDGVTWSYSISSGAATINKGSYSGNLTTPSTLGGYPVKSIANGAFQGCTGLLSVKISQGVTSIADNAFYGCSALMSVSLPNGITRISGDTFRGCVKLTEVTIPNGVTALGSEAFYGCSGLISVTIPDTVTGIANSAFDRCTSLKEVTIPSGVTTIGSAAFAGCRGLTSVTISEGVAKIDGYVFENCSGLTSVTIPSSVTSIGDNAFYGCSGLTSVSFLGAPPSGIAGSRMLDYCTVKFPREYAAEWRGTIGVEKFGGYTNADEPAALVSSATIRKNDPTIMDVVYKVTSKKSSVKVRALAFQDGQRSFAKVVRPTDFIEGTGVNIGDNIAPNVEHKLSWRISSDRKVDLAKIKFEVLACDGELLPLELISIPASANHVAMDVSWNAITERPVFDALLWLYASGDAGLTLNNGVLRNGSTQLASGTGISATAAITYVYSKMGFSILSGDLLKYANDMTRLGLSPSGVRQYGWREVK